MPLNNVVPRFFLCGFVLIAAVAAITLAVFLVRYKRPAILWFYVQLAALTGCFYFFYRIMAGPFSESELLGYMAETNSVRIGCAGILWAISMVCMVAGFCFLLRKKQNDGKA